VRRLFGGGTDLQGNASWIVSEGDESDPPLIMERFVGAYNGGISLFHSSRRTVVFRDSAAVQYVPDCDRVGGVGDVFIEDIVVSPFRICGGQRAWARQLNTEASEMDVNVTDNSTLWWVACPVPVGR